MSDSAGSKTSEFRLTKYVLIGGAVLEALALVLHSLQEQGLGGQVVVTALLVVGVALQVASLLGYQRSRATVKAAEALANVAVKVEPSEPQIPSNPS